MGPRAGFVGEGRGGVGAVGEVQVPLFHKSVMSVVKMR